MPDYKLHYFDTRARAEVARILFAAAGQPFEDVRYTPEQWVVFKPKTPFGQLPCLEVDGKLYGQSNAINSYLARKFGFHGKTNIEALQIDVVIGVQNDLTSVMIKYFTETDEQKRKELKEKLLKEDAPKFLGNFEKLLQDNGYYVGNSVTVAEIAVNDLIDYLLLENPDVLKSYTKLTQMRKNLEAHSKIGPYYKIRK
ncbi:hypothetical protein LOTGIDRAFT_173480 [Lottia gigantea]|uniref:Glutathione transferase n=1 Tax=Lottia gigantea TaxID=225164 RepID=V4B0R0_LOTGI|nr:hypothetical protein LOTGIDRAFT_173480 [Lottia gigantea]ESO99821.1 hypothetical protein LOTGIDRAFT_173480 [Lottia gigantea]